MKPVACLLIFFLLFISIPVAAQVTAKVNAGGQKQAAVQYGTASFYANKFQGRPMFGGALYDKNKMTCAHNSLPLGTWIKVTNLRNRKQVIVKVTDRLHHKNKRLVDLSRVAASKLGFVARGVARVKVEVLNENVLPE